MKILIAIKETKIFTPECLIYSDLYLLIAIRTDLST